MFGLRRIQAYRDLTKDVTSADEDLLPESPIKWTGGTIAGVVGAVVFLLLLGYAIPEQHGGSGIVDALRDISQFVLYLATGLLLPIKGRAFIRRRWGTNPPTAVVGVVMLLLSPLNILFMGFCGAIFMWLNLILGYMKMGIFGYLPDALLVSVAVFMCIASWLEVVWRSRVLSQMRANLSRERNRADVEAESRRLAEIELRSLQAQIEPHFLYNTLANVQHLIGSRPVDAEAMLTGLIRYLRESLPKMRSTCSTLEQEFALATAYLDIARIRLGGRLGVDFALPAELRSFPFSPLVLQTLVENALKHGVEPKVGPVTIRISASAENGEVCVTVADDGVGLGSVQGIGIGLRNTRERLAAIYGPTATLKLAPNIPSGVVASVCIPVENA